MYLLRNTQAIAGLMFVLFLSACAEKSDKYNESGRQACQNSKVKNEFIAHWYNAQPTLIISEDVQAFINSNQDKLKFIEPNYSLKLQNQLKTVRFNKTLSAYKILNEIGVLDAWRAGYQGDNIVIAVIDSGVDPENSKLRSNFYVNRADNDQNNIDDDNNGFIDDGSGWNFTNNSSKNIDEIGHGTSIAGIISGRDMSGESLGIAPAAKILPLDIMSGANGNEFDAKRAVDYAVQMKANIINNSWTITCSYYLASTFKQYENDNIIFVNSAGNVPLDVYDNRVMLASLDLANFLNVGSTNLYGKLSSFSGYGRTINIWSPGEQVPVLTLNRAENVITKASGTSVSAAIVSGAAALVWSAHPNESAVQIVSRLKRGAATISGRKFIAVDRAY